MWMLAFEDLMDAMLGVVDVYPFSLPKSKIKRRTANKRKQPTAKLHATVCDNNPRVTQQHKGCFKTLPATIYI